MGEKFYVLIRTFMREKKEKKDGTKIAHSGLEFVPWGGLFRF